MDVELVDHMGTDISVVNAARVSFDKESEWEYERYTSEPDKYGLTYDLFGDPKLSDKDTKLINYLARHNHWTPFGHAFASFRIKAPIFVARQLGKHQVGLVWNEVSRRYVDADPEFYSPDKWRQRAENVKQGSADEEAQLMPYTNFCLSNYADEAKQLYKRLLQSNVCPEQARMVLPQSMYTEWIWSGSLIAFARVCKLRLDSHTQYETRLVAEQIAVTMENLFPVSWKALMNETSN